MIEFIVWLILFALIFVSILLFHYWSTLLPARDQFSKSELLDMSSIMSMELRHITDRGNQEFQYIAIIAGALFSWILALFGGMVSPENPPAPDHAGHFLSNYFFQSFLILPAVHGIWPFIKDLAAGKRNGPAAIVARLDLAFFTGLAASMGALPLAVWGVYHRTYFLFGLLNAFICILYAIFRLRRSSLPGHEEVESEFEYDSYEEQPFEPTSRETGFASTDFAENNLNLRDEDLDDLHDFDGGLSSPAAEIPPDSTPPAESETDDTGNLLDAFTESSADFDDIPGLEDFEPSFGDDIISPEPGDSEESSAGENLTGDDFDVDFDLESLVDDTKEVDNKPGTQ